MFEKVWFKTAISVFCSLYGIILVWLSYMSLFYKISYVNKPVFAFIYVAATLTFLAIMFFARKLKAITILSIIMMALIIPVVILNLGDWLLIIPAVLLVVTMFFASGATETVKTVFGTIFLLTYILTALGFFVYTNLFITSSKDKITVLQNGVSSTEFYRYYIVDVKDNSGGRTEVYVEPNQEDIDFKIVKFKINGYAQRKYNERNHNIPTIEWRDGDTLYINGEYCKLKEWKWQFSLD